MEIPLVTNSSNRRLITHLGRKGDTKKVYVPVHL